MPSDDLAVCARPSSGRLSRYSRLLVTYHVRRTRCSASLRLPPERQRCCARPAPLAPKIVAFELLIRVPADETAAEYGPARSCDAVALAARGLPVCGMQDFVRTSQVSSRQCCARDHYFLHIRGAFVNAQGANFAIKTYDNKSLSYAVAAEQLHGGIDDVLRSFRCMQLLPWQLRA